MCRKGENIFLRKDGRWEARYIKKYDINNKAVYGYVYGKSYTEVKKKKNNKILEYKNIENKTKSSNSFEYSINLFLEQKKITVKESTYARYIEMVNRYIIPYFKEFSINEIELNTVIKVYDTYYTHLSSKTKRDILVLLNQIFKFAKIDIKIPYPKLEKKDIVILEQDENIKLENYIFSNLNNTTLVILICLYTGIRIGEICALTWKDVDLNNKTITINKTLERITDINNTNSTKVIISTPKSKSSIRKIPIPSMIIPYLKEFQKEDNSYILTRNNRFVEPRNLRYSFSQIIKKLDINCKFHTLRHTFATRCIENGVDPKTLSKILGHSSVKITLELYVHPRTEHLIECMEKLSFLGSQNNSQKDKN